jgi:NTP pyrophosphatase (non-canonical NTP hydrolase)
MENLTYAALRRVATLTEKDLENKTVWQLLASTTEELGEFSRELQIEEGVFGNTYKELDEGTIGEAADVVICALTLYFARGGDLNRLADLINKKLDKWEKAQNHAPDGG